MLETLYCPYCGKARSSDWAFCAHCSKRLPEANGSSLEAGVSSVQPSFGEICQSVEAELRRGDIQKAEGLALQALDARPQSADALALMGMVRLRQYKVEASRDCLDEAIKLSPLSPFVRVKAAEYWLALGMPNKAIEELRQAMIGAADDPDTFERLRVMLAEVEAKNRWSMVRSTPREARASKT